MTDQEITTAIHSRLKAAAQRIFEKLENIQSGNYTSSEIDKILNLSGRMNIIAMARNEIRNHPATEERNNKIIADVIADLYNIGITDEIVAINVGTFTASMPATLAFAKLAQWEKEFKIKTSDRAKFIKEEEKEVLFSCVLDIPKEAKYISEYAGIDPIRPNLMGVYLDFSNSCLVATDTTILTEIPVAISELSGDAQNLIIDPKVIKALAGQRCTLEYLKDAEKNIRIKAEKSITLTCKNITGNYPAYRRVYPTVNRDGLIEITKDGIQTLESFAKGTTRQTKATKDRPACIAIEIPAFSTTGTATFKDFDYNSERKVIFTVKNSPRFKVRFGINAFNLIRLVKNWNGCMWFTDPSRPIVFDHNNTRCTISMPMQLLDRDEISETCPGVINALERHNKLIPEPQPKQIEEPTEMESREIVITEEVTPDNKKFPIETTPEHSYINIVTGLLEIFTHLGTILIICHKFIEIEDLAKGIGIDLTSSIPTGEERSRQAPPDGIMPEPTADPGSSVTPEGLIVEKTNTSTSGSPSVNPRFFCLHLGPPGTMLAIRGKPRPLLQPPAILSNIFKSKPLNNSPPYDRNYSLAHRHNNYCICNKPRIPSSLADLHSPVLCVVSPVFLDRRKDRGSVQPEKIIQRSIWQQSEPGKRNRRMGTEMETSASHKTEKTHQITIRPCLYSIK